ncbi:zinc finger protein 836-like [Dendronephthya gigantea]|uniref:zinc finger protein 836-like n=1 Tax=Dendronephthya gigantea TaxID=151771 RepID=UPI0010692C86|nr:zinc finger protein 836-like [Dendronephthya gigantea]
MEEIPVEYNIIIEALNCAVQNQQQAESGEGQANFEFVVINNTNGDQVEAQGQSSLDCAQPLQHEQQVELVDAGESQITFETVGNSFTAVTPATTNDVLGVSTEEQEGETAQATEAIQPREKTHKCGVCNKAFLHAGSLKRHAKSHEEKTQYDCTECDKSFTQLGNLLRHQRSHTGDNPYKCTHCDKTFPRMDAMKTHQKSHSNDGQSTSSNIEARDLNCQVCGEAFEKMSLLKKHLKTHGVKAFQCDLCDKSFSVESAFIVHKRKHTGEKPHACDQCDRTFSQTGNLNRHKLTHADYKPFQCETCERKFNRMDLLKTHRKIHERVENGFPCNLCSELFSLKNDLKAHKKAAHPVLCCKACRARFSDPVLFEKHFKTHRRDNPYKCNICEMCYSDAESLVNHIAGHVKKEHKCEVCGMIFGNVGAMKQHMRKHTGERPYVCDVCGMSFSQVGNMRRHKDNHTDVRPYKCPFCPKTFKRKDLMKTHGKVHLPKISRGRKRATETIQISPSKGTSEANEPSQACEEGLENNLRQAGHSSEESGAANQDSVNMQNNESSDTGQTNETRQNDQIPHQCLQCGEKCDDPDTLTEHLKTHDVPTQGSSSEVVQTGADTVQTNTVQTNTVQTNTVQTNTVQTNTSRRVASAVSPRKKTHTCDVCNKSFDMQSGLVNHKRTHTGEKPFACDQCELRFAQRGNLVRHKRKHSGVTPFKCHVCDKEFGRKDFLNLHMTKCHEASQ